MGATIQVDGRTAIISGVEGFTGADVHAPDLRAGAALVIAGLSAKGFTTVSDIDIFIVDTNSLNRSLNNWVERFSWLTMKKKLQSLS